MNPDYPLTKRRIEIILALLKKRDLHPTEIAEKAFICVDLARKYAGLLIDMELAHAVRWEQTNGRSVYVPILRAGKGESAPVPARMTVQERTARYRAVRKKDPEREDRLNSARNARRRKIIPDPLMAWIPVRETARGAA